MVGLLNVVLPAAERWFVATYNEALPLVKDPRLAEDMRGFIGQEATHAETHEKILNDFMIARGLDLAPILRQVDHIFSHVLAASTSPDPRRRFNQLCDRLWLIAAIEHYTAVLGDFALNCAWDDHGADPTLVDLFRWHGSEEVEHRNVAHEVAACFHDSYLDRIRSMGLAVTMLAGFFQRWARRPDLASLEVDVQVDGSMLWLHPRVVQLRGRRWRLPRGVPSYPVKLPEVASGLTLTELSFGPQSVRLAGSLPEWRAEVPRARVEDVLTQLSVVGRPLNLTRRRRG